MAVDREKIIKAIEICYTVEHNCTECPYFSKDDCNDGLMQDALTLLREQDTVEHAMEVLKAHGWKDETEVTGMPDLNQLEKDHKLVVDNLKDALEYEKNLNQQLMGRLDIYQSIMDRLWRLLIDKATERR